MSKRKSNKKAKLQILSFLNRNKSQGDMMFGYYTLSDSAKGYCIRLGGVPYTLSRAIPSSYRD